MPSSQQQAWLVDQLTKSAFFHQKLHLWGLLEVADAIDAVQGEELNWNLSELNISQKAWDKVIHRGIKPVIVFAHPEILRSIANSTGYYRMLAMVSQKSMGHTIGAVTRFEQEKVIPHPQKALVIARHLNKIVSNLVETDEKVDAREFLLWRGMTAGAQADGSWRNLKGNEGEIVAKGMLQRRLLASGLLQGETSSESSRYLTLPLIDGRIIKFGDEPDIGIYRDTKPLVAVEIKGGIDNAGVLERIGAALKSLRRIKEENPRSITILIMQAVSVSDQAIEDLNANRDTLNYWFTMEELLDEEVKREAFFKLINI